MGNLNRQTWISFLRVIAMLFIVGCHLAVESSIQMIQLASQFLNVGVQIFFMISGFLFGYRKADDNVFQWYQRRAKRIFPVYYCFLLILLMIYLITGQKLILKNWIVSICCLQGIQIYLYGAEHLWFLSVLCLCYIITPAFKCSAEKKQRLPLDGGFNWQCFRSDDNNIFHIHPTGNLLDGFEPVHDCLSVRCIS